MSRRLMLRNASGGGERVYLLKDGVYSPIISGFEKKGFNSNLSTVVIGTTVYVYVGGNSTAATATTILPFDCTGYSRLGMKYSKINTDTANALDQIALSDNVINGNYETSFIGKQTLSFPRSSTEIEYETDISAVVGNKYLSFIVNKWNNRANAAITVSEIWIE